MVLGQDSFSWPVISLKRQRVLLLQFIVCNIPSLRRFTIETHPKKSEAPHLKSPIPHPKTDCSTNQIAFR